MKSIERYISPQIASQFPAYYQSAAEPIVAFAKAYYEWLEDHYQIVTVDSNTSIVVGDTVAQGNAAGSVINVSNNDVMINVSSAEKFKCKHKCDDLLYMTSSSGANTLIDSESSASSVYHARRLLDYIDIDKTTDAFISHFKNAYLYNIDFDTATNKQLLVKHSLDLYRAKGTERAVELFFKLVYGTEATVDYPGDRVLKPSDGTWKRDQYLEITSSSRTVDLVGKQITGTKSGATGFVEKYVKRRAADSYVHVLYLTAISGAFETGDLLYSSTVYRNSPRIIGSVRLLEIIDRSRNFAVGDTVVITSTRGINAKARVSAISNETGAVDFILIDGNWGYTVNAQSLVSEKVLTLTNTDTSGNSTANAAFRYFERLYQPTANVDYSSGNTTFTAGSRVAISNGTANVATAKVLAASGNTTQGNVYISIEGNTFVNAIATGNKIIVVGSANAQANIIAIEDKTKFANVIGLPNTAILTAVAPIVNSTAYVFGSTVYQLDGNGVHSANGSVTNVVRSLTEMTLEVENIRGAFRKGTSLYVNAPDGTANAGSANLSAVQVTVGVYAVNGSFTDSYGATVFAGNTQTVANVATISQGTGAQFAVGSIGETETIFIGTDLISQYNAGYLAANGTPVSNQQYTALPLNNFAYGFPKNRQGNSSTTIYNCLNFDNFTIGSISTFANVNPGSDYNAKPYVLVYQPEIAGFGRGNYVMQISNASEQFIVGEKITQTLANLVYTTVTVSNTVIYSAGQYVYQSNGTANTWTATVDSIVNGTSIIVRNEAGTIDTTGANSANVLHAGGADYTFTYDTATANIAVDMQLAVSNSTANDVGVIIVRQATASNSSAGSFVGTLVAGAAVAGYTVTDVANTSLTANLASLAAFNAQATASSSASIEATAKGLVEAGSNNSTLYVKRITFDSTFATNTTIVGQSSGATATVDRVERNLNALPIGLNAQVEANVVTANGAVVSLEVTDSGIGYSNGTIVSYSSEDQQYAGTARAIHGGIGLGTGYFTTSKGFLSSEITLHDNDLYQEYSYQILSRIAFDKYADMFKKALHMAGTKVFGSVVIDQYSNTVLQFADSAIEIE